ncbi:DUF2268 domain-containing protein [Shouchella patagoniensis]|uniref:DUF2268 domain-containing protein n=1 Tax=Shouchella patagoniensis TaxID=228576 RepID=UPI000994DA90|nr:DUF2268 domain-containing protein [Shouchella patagoniensis]
MKYEVVDTFRQYEELLAIKNVEKRAEYFRYTMMKPFEEMWEAIHVPLKAKQESGYDVLIASKMLGFADVTDSKTIKQSLATLKQNQTLEIAAMALKTNMKQAMKHGLVVQAEEVKLGLFIADREKLSLQKGYVGFGGIPGFIQLMVYPTSYNLPKIPALIAHEFHHNLRFSYMEWNHGNVTVGDYLVIEGLAESYAKELFGEKQMGPWVTTMDADDLDYSIAVIAEALDVRGFAEVSSYMFGDEIARKEGYKPVGLSFGAGYAVGYKVVQAFMEKTNKTIFEATLLSSEEIIEESGVF